MPLEPAIRESSIDICVSMQSTLVTLADSYLRSLNRHCYITPTSFLDLIHTFSAIFKSKRDEVSLLQKRYHSGLEKLDDTAEQVKVMQSRLESLKPKLIQSTHDTEQLMVTVKERTEEADKTRVVVEAEEASCNQQQEAAQKIKDECQVRQALRRAGSCASVQ